MLEYGEGEKRKTRRANHLREDPESTIRTLVEGVERVRIFALGSERGGSDRDHICICNRNGQYLIQIHIPIQYHGRAGKQSGGRLG